MARILLLMNYGGIYLDNDMFVVKSLDKYRVYEMTVSKTADRGKEVIGNQVMIAHRNARFLRAYYDSYRFRSFPVENYGSFILMSVFSLFLQ